MNRDMDVQLNLNKALNSKSDVIQDMCDRLKMEGVLITPDKLAQIISVYEAKKLEFVKDILENVIEFEELEPLLDDANTYVVIDSVNDKIKTLKGEDIIEVETDLIS